MQQNFAKLENKQHQNVRNLHGRLTSTISKRINQVERQDSNFVTPREVVEQNVVLNFFLDCIKTIIGDKNSVMRR